MLARIKRFKKPSLLIVSISCFLFNAVLLMGTVFVGTVTAENQSMTEAAKLAVNLSVLTFSASTLFMACTILRDPRPARVAPQESAIEVNLENPVLIPPPLAQAVCPFIPEPESTCLISSTAGPSEEEMPKTRLS